MFTLLNDVDAAVFLERVITARLETIFLRCARRSISLRIICVASHQMSLALLEIEVRFWNSPSEWSEVSSWLKVDICVKLSRHQSLCTAGALWFVQVLWPVGLLSIGNETDPSLRDAFPIGSSNQSILRVSDDKSVDMAGVQPLHPIIPSIYARDMHVVDEDGFTLGINLSKIDECFRHVGKIPIFAPHY